MKTVAAWSYGGGVQSVAIGVLIKQGVLDAPDLAGICDTGRERATTWRYMEEVMLPYLSPLVIERIPHGLSTVDLYPDGDLLPLIPAYTRNKVEIRRRSFSGDNTVTKDGRLPTYCSAPWKRDTFSRWLRSKGVEDCGCWIGFSKDEHDRVKDDRMKWLRYRYPLIELGLTRAACLKLIDKAGLPPPHKSRCYMCPHQTDAEWLDVRSDPEDWDRAVALDEEIRDNDPEGAGLFLHNSRVPLRQVKLAGGGSSARPCEGGHCWT